MAQERRGAGDKPVQDDLFGKLDELMGRHQGRPARRRAQAPVPTLTEAVAPPPQQLEIPVLNEVVEIQPARPHGDPDKPAAEGSAPLIDKRKQLQVTLYLRLRQRLDEELQAALAAHAAVSGSVSDPSAAQLARELRSALPSIVREVVDQVFGADQPAPGDKSGGEDGKL
jgi:hypothetical protein